ncbi:MAG: outer membrane lipoprotein chaperone LolA [Methylococcales bacterium]|nr:outer membrane lipoprotein chaperone LolA [Methylococcales bacterium]
MKKILLILTLCLGTQVSHAQEPLEQLKKFLKNSKTLTASFKQVLFDKDHKIKKTSKGLFFLSRPGKFRWSYQTPFVQEIVSNSGKIWFYDKDLEQVTIKKMDESMGATPALLLSGNIDIEEKFTIESQGENEGLTWIKLLPKNAETSFKYVLIGLDGRKLGGMELYDNFGQLTRIYFSDTRINPFVDENKFIFTIPEGTDVFNN